MHIGRRSRRTTRIPTTVRGRYFERHPERQRADGLIEYEAPKRRDVQKKNLDTAPPMTILPCRLRRIVRLDQYSGRGGIRTFALSQQQEDTYTNAAEDLAADSERLRRRSRRQEEDEYESSSSDSEFYSSADTSDEGGGAYGQDDYDYNNTRRKRRRSTAIEANAATDAERPAVVLRRSVRSRMTVGEASRRRKQSEQNRRRKSRRRNHR